VVAIGDGVHGRPVAQQSELRVSVRVPKSELLTWCFVSACAIVPEMNS
jgi:hypothetical protein